MLPQSGRQAELPAYDSEAMMPTLEQSTPSLDFEVEHERLSSPIVQHSSEAAREVLKTIGDRAAYYAQFPRDQARVLRIIVGDLTRAVQQ